MKIVFFGSPAAALPSLEMLIRSGHSVELVVTQPDKPAGRGRRLLPCTVKAYAVERNLPVIEPLKIRRDETVLERLRMIRPDIHVVVAYGQIMPGPIIDFPPHGSVNVHFSLLPKYRGASPVAWAILEGEKKTGVTIFRLNERMDEGDMLAVAETDIGPRETCRELETRLAALGADLLKNTLKHIDSISPVPQDHALATLAPKIRKDDGRIDWNRDSDFIDRMVRAYTPWPTAFTFRKGKRILIRRGQNLPGHLADGRPGRILTISSEGLDIACGFNSRAGRKWRPLNLYPPRLSVREIPSRIPEYPAPFPSCPVSAFHKRHAPTGAPKWK
jgi:methionyl-tRNA formyltransferase